MCVKIFSLRLSFSNIFVYLSLLSNVLVYSCLIVTWQIVSLRWSVAFKETCCWSGSPGSCPVLPFFPLVAQSVFLCLYKAGKNLSLPNYFFHYYFGNATFLCSVSEHWPLQSWLLGGLQPASLWESVSPPSALRLCLSSPGYAWTNFHSFVLLRLPLNCLHSFFAGPPSPLFGVCFLRHT